MSIRVQYRFEVDGRGRHDGWRDDWETAAADAVNAGYAHWSDKNKSLRLDDGQGAAIARRHVRMEQP